MVRKIISKGLLVVAAGCGLHSTALAGGLDRGGYNIDLLFDPSRFAVESSATFVMPQRKVKNVRDIRAADGDLDSPPFSFATSGVEDSESYFVPRIGMKAGIGDSADCMLDYSEPWGAHAAPGRNWAGANSNIETKVESRNYAATCSYRFDAGPGQLRIIGGAFYQEVFGFKERQVVPDIAVPGTGVGRLDLEGDGWGWRAGVAYEIPEYAFRASLVYNSEVNLDDITGTLDLSQVNGLVLPVTGAQKMPDTVELKVQSGIAPDWLAFGSVKWTDWSQLQKVRFYCDNPLVPLCASPAGATSLDLGYRDGWTISGGVGHKFNEQWSGAVSVTWDRGTSQGYGTQTDTWTFGAGVAYSPNQNVEIRLGGVLGVMTGGSSGTVTLDGETYGADVNYDFDDDLVAALSTSLKIKF
ncbi:OmpP1/FadL family transporter [Neorhizobium huautlense]|uniref:OmpP1/FadL family transporter n=1 Tax=Neorhizobium huautlense TaxID=67774 RepID=UPI000CF9CA77|nr:OmpP1/FadL family transporter [Neorhizobium huautlense]